MRTTPPHDIADNLLPVVMTPMRSLEVIGQDDVRPVVLLGPAPGHFGAVAVAEFVPRVAFVAVWGGLEGCCEVEFVDVY